MRVQNEGTGKSSWWMLNPDAKPGKYKTIIYSFLFYYLSERKYIACDSDWTVNQVEWPKSFHFKIIAVPTQLKIEAMV